MKNRKLKCNTRLCDQWKVLQCWLRTGHLPAFFVPVDGHLAAQVSLPPGNLHDAREKMPMPGGYPQGGGGMGAPGIDWCITGVTLTNLGATESFNNDDGDGSENVKKAIGLLNKTTTLHVHHAFLYISLPPLQDYNVKMPNFTFYRGRKQAATNFSFSF